MLRKVVMHLAIVVGLLQPAVTAFSCLTLNSTSYGNMTLSNNFTDYDYLLATEDFTFYNRLATV